MNKIKNFNNLNSYTFFFSVICVGIVWALTSPVSSAADDDFHLTSIWCNSGNTSYCKKIGDNKYLVPGKLNTGIIPDRFTGLPPCYVTWPKSNQSAECLNNKSNNLTYSDRFNSTLNAKVYYLINSKLISSNVESGIAKIRISNVLMFGLILLYILRSSNITIQNSLQLAIGLTIVPISIFFIASTNPISWSMTSIIFNPIILHKILSHKKKYKTFWFDIVLYTITFLIGFVSRFDTILYLFIMSLIVIIIRYKNNINSFMQKINSYSKIIIQFLITITTFMIINQILKIYYNVNPIFIFKDKDEFTPDPIINLLIEFPSFLLGLLGGQQPNFVQNVGELGANYTYGPGWLEYNFLSITGIFLGFCNSVVLFKCLKKYDQIKLIVINIWFTSFLSLLIITRAFTNFKDGSYFQPRYFSAYLTAFIMILILISYHQVTSLNGIERVILNTLLFIGGFSAWAVVFTRYKSGLNYPVTNFQNPELWANTFINSTLLLVVSFFSHLLFYLTVFDSNYKVKLINEENINEQKNF